MSIMSHQTHDRSFQGRYYTGYAYPQPTVSKNWSTKWYARYKRSVFMLFYFLSFTFPGALASATEKSKGNAYRKLPMHLTEPSKGIETMETIIWTDQSELNACTVVQHHNIEQYKLLCTIGTPRPFCYSTPPPRPTSYLCSCGHKEVI